MSESPVGRPQEKFVFCLTDRCNDVQQTPASTDPPATTRFQNTFWNLAPKQQDPTQLQQCANAQRRHTERAESLSPVPASCAAHTPLPDLATYLLAIPNREIAAPRPRPSKLTSLTRVAPTLVILACRQHININA